MQPLVILAPMAGVTDFAFRTICAELGADVTVTEMVSSRALCFQDRKSRALLRRTPTGRCGAQIFGDDPALMAGGAQLALEYGAPDFIDINMGCPTPKVVIRWVRISVPSMPRQRKVSYGILLNWFHASFVVIK